MRKTKRILSLLLSLVLLVPFCSCSSSEEKSVREGNYHVVCADIAPVDGCQSVIRGVWHSNDSYCVQVRYDDDIKHFCKLYYFNKSGELINTIETKADYWLRFVKDNRIYAQYGRSEIAVLNYDDASAINTFKVDDNVMTIAPTDDGYIVCGENNIIKYDLNNNMIATIPLNGTDVFGKVTYFKSDNKEYMADDESNYYILDFDNKELKLFRSGCDINIGANQSYGQLVIKQSGMYRFDINNCELSQVFNWSDIDVKPGSKMMKNDIKYYVFDEDNLAAVYDYSDNSAEVMFLSYDEAYRDERERIVIGGFRTSDDTALKWAVYNYNMSQNKYRAVIEDYSEQFGSMDGYDAEKQNLKLTKYFDEGHAPDMFCGMDFDYQSWGRSGVVKDLIPLINKYDPDLLDGITPNIRTAMSAGDKCYSILTSYDLEGCFGRTSDLNGNNVTIDDLAKANTGNGKHIYDSMYHYDVADSVMERVINNRRCGIDDGNVFDKQTMESIVKFSVDNGQRLSDPWEGYSAGDYMLKSRSLGSIVWFAAMCQDDFEGARVTFYGDPSVYGSVHMAQPTGIIAVSSSTDKDEECIRIISYMLDYDVQKKAAVINGKIPVDQKVLDEICEYAEYPDRVPAGDLYECYFQMDRMMIEELGGNSIPKTIVEDFRNAVEQVDSIRTFDWGVFNILYEEIASHEYQDKSVEEVAQAINSRLKVYLDENYPC